MIAMMDKRCGNCFCVIKDTYKVCPKCGHRIISNESETNALPEGTVLSDKYLIGRVLGEGGFGITYLAWDINLEIRIAVKEFFPSNRAVRDEQDSRSVKILTNSKDMRFGAELDRYVNEASILAKLFNLPGIVSVKDFFYENQTAYMIMEYIDGISLKEYLKRKGGTLPYKEVMEIIEPVINSLEVIHQHKLLHRDISPDNIMISDKGLIKLIDFGAARYYENETEKSMTVVLKHGYAPLEQYSRNGEQGSWTDVYSLCAVMYYMITGHVPTEAIDRAANDSLVPIRTYRKEVPKKIAQVIERGLSLSVKERWQNMRQLHEALYLSEPINTNGRAYLVVKNGLIIVIFLLLILILIAGWLIVKGNSERGYFITEESVEYIAKSDELEDNRVAFDEKAKGNTIEEDSVSEESSTWDEKSIADENIVLQNEIVREPSKMFYYHEMYYEQTYVLDYTFHFSYDEDNRLDVVSYYDENHNYLRSVKQEYDQDGNCIKQYSLAWNVEELYLGVTTNEWENGMKIKAFDDNEVNWDVFENNEEGKPIKEYSYENGDCFMVSEYTYDDRGREVECYRDNYYGGWIQTISSFYEGESDKPSKVIWETDGVISEIYEYEYVHDEYDRLIKETECVYTEEGLFSKAVKTYEY